MFKQITFFGFQFIALKYVETKKNVLIFGQNLQFYVGDPTRVCQVNNDCVMQKFTNLNVNLSKHVRL